jgi:hypothetical protein
MTGVGGCFMKRAPVYRAVDSACARVGQSTQTAGIFLAALCFIFAATFAACTPSSLESRIVNLFFVGLIPSLLCYASGVVLRQMLGLSCELCEIIAARCVRLLAPLANALAKRLWRWHVDKAFFRFSCLLIRKTARFLIRMQLLVGR